MILKIHTPTISDGSGNVEVTFRSDSSARVTVAVIPMRESAFRKALAAWAGGELIQDAFPTLNADQRELVKTGIGPVEWEELFGE